MTRYFKEQKKSFHGDYAIVLNASSIKRKLEEGLNIFYFLLMHIRWLEFCIFASRRIVPWLIDINSFQETSKKCIVWEVRVVSRAWIARKRLLQPLSEYYNLC